MLLTGRTIAIIDDDESVRKALQRLLRSVGVNAVTFATAEEFLEAAGESAPACLILDVHLPGLDGLELQKRLNAEGRCIPVVFVTAYRDEQMCERALRAGALAFLHKPFQSQALLDALARALE